MTTEKYRWIPIEERLPDDGQEVLVIDKEGTVPFIGHVRHIAGRPVWYVNKDSLSFVGNGYLEDAIGEVIAWCPLPALPSPPTPHPSPLTPRP